MDELEPSARCCDLAGNDSWYQYNVVLMSLIHALLRMHWLASRSRNYAAFDAVCIIGLYTGHVFPDFALGLCRISHDDIIDMMIGPKFTYLLSLFRPCRVQNDWGTFIYNESGAAASAVVVVDDVLCPSRPCVCKRWISLPGHGRWWPRLPQHEEHTRRHSSSSGQESFAEQVQSSCGRWRHSELDTSAEVERR